MRRTFVVGALAVLLVFFGCMPPKIMLQVERPPTWNTAGLKRIAVMPYEPGRNGQDIANHLTQEAISMITATGNFTVVSAAEVERLRQSGESLANHVDAILSGKIMNVASKDEVQTSQYKNKQGEMVTLTTYIRTVSLEISFQLERTRDGSLVGTTTKSASQRDAKPDPGSLMSVAQMLRRCNVQAGLISYLAPHKVAEQRTLMAEKTSDKVLKDKMKSAEEMVKQRNYRAALDAYNRIYNEYRSFAAVFNASVMQEALGDIPAAIELMRKAEMETGNPAAATAIARMSQQIQDKETIETVHKAAVRPIERVTEHASNEALSYLPDGARVWFVNNSKSERELAVNVVDNITAVLISSGITIVDREHTQLIERELQQQMGGSISDDDILSAGRQAGANTIIIIAISGIGSMRRLQMRILDVERGVPLMQSGADSNWEL